MLRENTARIILSIFSISLYVGIITIPLIIVCAVKIYAKINFLCFKNHNNTIINETVEKFSNFAPI